MPLAHGTQRKTITQAHLRIVHRPVECGMDMGCFFFCDGGGGGGGIAYCSVFIILYIIFSTGIKIGKMCKFCALYEMGFLGTCVGWRGSFLQRAAAHNSEQSTTEECLQCPTQN